MTNGRTQLDPVQGLVDYVLEIKPYHTKIVEVLVEYIQVEPIDVTFTEDIDMCVNLGIPDLDSRYSYPIIGVDTITNTFTIAGDQLSKLHVGQVMEVFRSSINDNRYTITSLVFDGDNTKVGVQTNIPSEIVDGVIVYRTIEFCPESNLYGEHAFEEVEEACGGGFGQIYDSLPFAYNIQSFNPGTNEIIFNGDLSSIFSVGNQLSLEYVYVTDISPDDLIRVEATYDVGTISVDNTDPLNPVTTITTVQSIPTIPVSGSPLPVPTITNQSIYPVDERIDITNMNDGGINIFSISGNSTAAFTTGSLVDVRYSDGNDGIYYVLQSEFVGGETKIYVAQHIPFPSATRKGQLQRKGIGFDEVAYCTQSPEARIDVRFDERIEFNTQINLYDNLIAYNFENTDSTPFGGLPYGTIVDTTEPTITSSATAPALPNLFDLWYDTSDATNAHLNRWNGLRWVGVSVANWFDSTNDKLYQRVYRKIDSVTVDTGWLEVTTIGGFDNYGQGGVGEVQPIAIQNYTATDIGGGVGQKVYTLATPVVGADPELLSVTVNGIPAAFTLNTSTSFTIEFLEGSPAADVQDIVNPGDWVIATVKDRNGVQSNVLVAGFSNEPHTVYHGPGYVSATNQEIPIIGNEQDYPSWWISGDYSNSTKFELGDTFTVSDTVASDGVFTVGTTNGYQVVETDTAILLAGSTGLSNDTNTSGYQEITLTSSGSPPTRTGADSTGLANDGTNYVANVVIDGITRQVNITGSAAQTYTNLLAQINNDIADIGSPTVIPSGLAELVNGNIRITSNSTGASSTIRVTDIANFGSPLGNTGLFKSLTEYVDKAAPVDGVFEYLYSADIYVDGRADPERIRVTGPSVQTWTQLFNAINSQLEHASLYITATAPTGPLYPTLPSTDILILSNSTGNGSSIEIVDTNLFSSIAGNPFIETPVPGINNEYVSDGNFTKIIVEEVPVDEPEFGTLGVTDRFEIRGGNFAYHFFGGTKFEGYDDSQKLGEWQITTFPVVAASAGGSPVAYTMSVVGDHTDYFTPGMHFYVDYTLSNKGWFSVVRSTFDGTNTVITVNEPVANVTFTNDLYALAGSPLAPVLQSQTQIEQNYSKNLGVIQGAMYDPSTLPYTEISKEWTQQQKVLSNDLDPNDGFGADVAISDDGLTLAVAAYGVDLSPTYTNEGAVYVFAFNTSTQQWEQQQLLLLSDQDINEEVGIVAISGDGNTIVVGVQWEDRYAALGDNAGAAHVFTRTGTVWTEQQELFSAVRQTDEQFGQTVSISYDGSIVAIGSKDTNGRGKVEIFVNSGGSPIGWNLQQSIVASDGADFDDFGGHIDISNDGNTIIVGALGVDISGNYTSEGAAYIFEYQSSPGQWIEQQKITASDSGVYYYFGTAVAISGDGSLIVIGAENAPLGNETGSAYTFRKSGSVWVEEQILVPSDRTLGEEFFGYDVDVSSDGTTIVIGAFKSSATGPYSNSGAAYVFEYNTIMNRWEQQKVLSSDITDNDRFGISVAISGDGNVVAIGADDQEALSPSLISGAVYTFLGEEIVSTTDRGPATIVIPQTSGHPDVDRILYEWLGPLHIDVDFLPTDLLNPSMPDTLSTSDQIISSANFLNIIDVDTVRDSFTVLGDHTSLFPTNAKFTIQSAYTDNGSPETTNNGTWTVDRSSYVGSGQEDTIDISTQLTPGGDFQISGDYADVFVPGFTFTVVDNEPIYFDIISANPTTNQFVIEKRIDILAADSTANTFTLSGDYSNVGGPGNFEVVGTTSNDGSYVTTAPFTSYNPSTDQTTVYVASVSTTEGAGGEILFDPETFQNSKIFNGGLFEVKSSQVGSPGITNDGFYTIVSSSYSAGQRTINVANVPSSGTGIYSVDNSGTFTVLSQPAGGGQTNIPVVEPVLTTHDSTVYWSAPDETKIYIVGNVVTDQQPYGKIIDINSTVGTQLSGSITDDLDFGWTVEDWFQYMILSVDLVENTITVAGNATSDLQIGQDFEILGAFDTTGSPPGGSPVGVTNNGLYKVRIDEDYRDPVGSPLGPPRQEVDYDGMNTTITVYPDLVTANGAYGFIEPNNDAQAIVSFRDTIGVDYAEIVDAVVVQTGGSIMDSWDYPFWDVGSFDETLGTVIHLYSNTFE